MSTSSCSFLCFQPPFGRFKSRFPVKIVPRLQALCKTRVAVNICNELEVKEIIFGIQRCLLDHYYEDENIKELEIWFKTLLESVSGLEKYKCDTNVLEKVIDFVPVVAVEILKWAKFHEEKFSLTFSFSQSFISSSLFTSNGTIGWEKAARGLMEETCLKPETKFDIACYYSLTDLMMKAWIDLPVVILDKSFSNHVSKDIIKAWTDQVSGSNINSVGREYENFLFHSCIAALESESEISFRYFWKQLNDTHKDIVVDKFVSLFHKKIKYLKTSQNFEFLCLCEPFLNMFILMFIESDKIRKRCLCLRDDFGYLLLKNMLRWPYQPLFINMSYASWDILSKIGFCNLLLEIINKINDPHVRKTYNYRRLLITFWMDSPEYFKRFVFSENTECDLKLVVDTINIDSPAFESRYLPFYYKFLTNLFTIKYTFEDDYNLCRDIMESATSEELSKIFCDCGEHVCVNIIRKGNFRSVEIFLKCCKINDADYVKRLKYYYYNYNRESPRRKSIESVGKSGNMTIISNYSNVEEICFDVLHSSLPLDPNYLKEKLFPGFCSSFSDRYDSRFSYKYELDLLIKKSKQRSFFLSETQIFIKYNSRLPELPQSGPQKLLNRIEKKSFW